MQPLIDSTVYIEGVRVEVEKPRLADNVGDTGPEQVITFGVTRYYREILEEGIQVVLTPKDAMALSVALDRVLLRGWGLATSEQ